MKSLINYFNDRYFWIAAMIGVALMLLTLHYDINPVEGSVVPQHVQGTGLHVFLFVTCIPAWILGYIIGYPVNILVPVSFEIMVCSTQFFLYGVLGKICRRVVRFIKPKKQE